jgi:hypothetical protein
MIDSMINGITTAPPKASFLGLPLEVRQMIYKFVLSAFRDLNAFEIDALLGYPSGKILCGEMFNINIVRPCRQCQIEATLVFWDANTLDFDSATQNESFDLVSHFLARNIVRREKIQRVLHCADQIHARFLNQYLSQVDKLTKLFPKCKTLDIKITGCTLGRSMTERFKAEPKSIKFALSFTQSHPTLVHAIRARQESTMHRARITDLELIGADVESDEISYLHFVTRDCLLKNGVCVAPIS